jgi:acyl dehydratase
MAMTDLDLRTLASQVGQEVAVSDWMEITQTRINQFADATSDHQWIHLDQARAAAESPFGRTIAHGFLTLSLVSAMHDSAFGVRARMVINYGANRIRFIGPVPAGSRVRGRFSVANVEHVDKAVQATWAVVIELEGATKPCCVLDWLVRYYVD